VKHLIFILLGSCLLVSSYGQNNLLPKPSGNFLIGVNHISLTDRSRKELFDNSQNSYRNLTIKVWYPTDIRTDYEPYLENADTVIKNWQFSENYRNLITHSSKGVPISKRENSYPILIFSHGWGEHFSQNTILMEELASHGYVIFSIAHHYECKFSFFPDGRFLNMDMNSTRFNQLLQEQQNPNAMSVFQKMFTAKTENDRHNIFVETNNLMPTLMKESPKYWAEDIIFFINELEKIKETNTIFKGKLDLNRIGVLGMSMGGMATNEVCVLDSKIKAGLNIDGGLFGPIIDETLNIPFMFLNSQRFSGYGDLFVSKSKNSCYSVTINNSDHYNFTDYALFPIQSTRQLGSIEATKPIEIMNSLILAFFDKYIMKKNNINLTSIAKKIDGEFVSNEIKN